MGAVAPRGAGGGRGGGAADPQNLADNPNAAGPLAVAAAVAGIAGAIGLLRGWPYAHRLAGAFPLVIAGLSIWNAVEMNMLVGRSILSTAAAFAAALLGLALVIADYRMAQK